MSFISLYSWTILLCAIPAFSRIAGKYRQNQPENQLLLLGALLLFCIIPFRKFGPDWETYRLEYLLGGIDIKDLGYLFIIKFFNSILIPFEAFILFSNLVILYALVNISRKLNVSPGIVLFIYLLHLFIVRDLAHMRTSLAIAFVFFGFEKKSLYKYVFYSAAISIHLSTLPLVLGLIIVQFTHKWMLRRFTFLLVGIIPFATFSDIIIANLLETFSSVSVRFRIYSNVYDSSIDFGSLATFAFFTFITIYVKLFINKRNIELPLQKTVCLNVLGLYFYATFGAMPEIGPRIFNVLMTFYPMQLAYTLDLYRRTKNDFVPKTDIKVLRKRGLRVLVVIAILSCFVLRPQTYELILKVGY